MPSYALKTWRSIAQGALDQLESAHRAANAGGPGRRYATLQIDYAYTVLLCSQFQGFCRALHAEVADVLVTRLSDTWARPLLRASLRRQRRLDRGNPTPSNLSIDFSVFWNGVVDGRRGVQRSSGSASRLVDGVE